MDDVNALQQQKSAQNIFHVYLDPHVNNFYWHQIRNVGNEDPVPILRLISIESNGKYRLRSYSYCSNRHWHSKIAKITVIFQIESLNTVLSIVISSASDQ